MHAKFSQKLTLLPPDFLACAYQGVRNLVFGEFCLSAKCMTAKIVFKMS